MFVVTFCCLSFKILCLVLCFAYALIVSVSVLKVACLIFACFFLGEKVGTFKCTKAAACLLVFNLSDIYNNSYFK